MVLAPCKLMRIRKRVMWQFAIIISRLLDFYGKMDVYMVEYRSKDKNIMQDNLAER